LTTFCQKSVLKSHLFFLPSLYHSIRLLDETYAYSQKPISHSVRQKLEKTVHQQDNKWCGIPLVFRYLWLLMDSKTSHRNLSNDAFWPSVTTIPSYHFQCAAHLLLSSSCLSLKNYFRFKHLYMTVLSCTYSQLTKSHSVPFA
jgi:hypothetical protein